MKGFFQSRRVLKLVAVVILLSAIVVPLSSSLLRSHAAAPSSLKGNVSPSTVAADPFNARLAIQVGTDGRFNIGAFPDPSTGGATSGSWDLMYRWPNSPGTSYSTLNIDGSNSIYGSSGTQIQAPQDADAKTNQSRWQVGDIQASQTLQLALNDQTAQEDNAKIAYSLTNTGTVAHTVGMRVMIDTEVNGNDGAILRVPGSGLVRKESEFTGTAVPDTMQSFFDVTDSQHVAAVTLKGAGATPPDRLVIAAWPHIYNTVYDYTIDPTYDFTDPSVARPDSAYAVYWNPVSLAPGQSLNYVTYYGLSQLNVNLAPPLALGISGPATLSVINNAYSPNPFTVTATVLNNGTADATNVALTLHLPTGLSLASGTATQNIGTLPVGQERDISWSVQAAPQSSQQTLTYSVDAVATNTPLKNVARQITLPLVQTAKPTVFQSWHGVNDSNFTPSDSTGAIGLTRYVELTNDQFAIYNRKATVLASGTLFNLTGAKAGSLLQERDELTDPQIFWDPQTSRFYYVVIDTHIKPAFPSAKTTNFIRFGFSKTDAPNGTSDWCNYNQFFNYGANFPDFPKLGDTQNLLLIGVDRFPSEGSSKFLSADVNWITKPPAASFTKCPAASSFVSGRQNNLLDTKGTKSTPQIQIFAPNPSIQTDPSPTGWIVSIPFKKPASNLDLFKVTQKVDSTGKVIGANIQTVATQVPVAAFSPPPPAEQAGTSSLLDTLLGQLTKAISAIDPSTPNSSLAIWTEHTVKHTVTTTNKGKKVSKALSEVRWYEINPSDPTHLFQSGSVTSKTLYVFNGAISPDRAVNVIAGTAAFGDSMALGFDTSSSTTDVTIQMVTKTSTGLQSSFIPIVKSPQGYSVFDCSSVCRWGDYSSATSDPAANTTASHGQVWFTNMWNTSSTFLHIKYYWRTQNWAVRF